MIEHRNWLARHVQSVKVERHGYEAARLTPNQMPGLYVAYAADGHSTSAREEFCLACQQRNNGYAFISRNKYMVAVR